jgi:hypothetical protein
MQVLRSRGRKAEREEEDRCRCRCEVWWYCDTMASRARTAHQRFERLRVPEELLFIPLRVRATFFSPFFSFFFFSLSCFLSSSVSLFGR